MSTRMNQLGQPIGDPLPDWSPPPHPQRVVLEGCHCRVEPLDAARHAASLFAANAEDAAGHRWTYLSVGPFTTLDAYHAWLHQHAADDDSLSFAIVDHAHGTASGVASYLRIAPPSGLIEVGHIALAPRLQRTPAATEALYLLMRHAFRLGYRRFEWKCDALNGPSRAAAQRLGLCFGGHFPPGAGLQGAQPRHGLVRCGRPRVARARGRLCVLARPGQLRHGGQAACGAARAHGAAAGGTRLSRTCSAGIGRVGCVVSR